MRGKRVGARGKVDKARRAGFGNLIPAHTIEDNHYDATHDTPWLSPLGARLIETAAELAAIAMALAAAATVYTLAKKFATARLLVGALGGSR